MTARQAAGQAADEARQVAARVLVGVDQPAGEHQAPGRGVDQHRVRLAGVAGPVGRGDLLGDQAVAGLLVGRAQQRFGQAHERQTLAGGEAELLKETLDHALAAGGLAGGSDQGLGLALDGVAVAAAQGRRGQQGGERRTFVGELAVVEVIEGHGTLHGTPAPDCAPSGGQDPPGGKEKGPASPPGPDLSRSQRST